jgi:hypothetical protein
MIEHCERCGRNLTEMGGYADYEHYRTDSGIRTICVDYETYFTSEEKLSLSRMAEFLSVRLSETLDNLLDTTGVNFLLDKTL